jgi:hypothetical protein
MTGARLGRKATLSLNGGTHGSPTWSTVDLISDLTVNAPWDETEASTRESAVKMAVQTLMALEVGGKVKFNETDSNLQTVLDAMSSGAVLDVMVLNGPSTANGCRGYRFDCQASMAAEDQGLGAVIFDEVKFKPTPSVNLPATVKVTTGAPVFTTL